jgi:serine/threonine-protein kinase
VSETPSATLGRYQIIREIARSNDIVYEAYDPQMNRRVALKEMFLQPGASEQQKRDRSDRFKREARAAGSLAHPNIVTIYEVGEEAGRLYIAMEYLEGKTLRNELDTAGLIPQARALEITEEVLRALEYAHKRGVIHRDIKPENVQLLDSGQVKITDFGIARLTFEPNLTLDGQVFGTPSYMSPEQVVGKDIDARSDLFSLGICLYEMVSGKKPFVGDHVVSITYAIMNRPPEPLPQVHPAVAQLIARALEKTTAMRFASATEMLVAVRAAKDALASPVTDFGAGAMSGGHGAYPFALPGAPTQYPPAPPPLGPAVPGPYVPHPGPGAPYPPPPQPYAPGGSQMPPTHYPLGSSVPPQFRYPMYYPLPPAKPWISPHIQAFIGRFITILILLALLFVLVPLIIGAVATALQSRTQDWTNAGTPPVASDVGPTAEERERFRRQAESAVARAETEPNPLVAAEIWEEAGRLYLRAEGTERAASSDATDAAICFYNAAAKLLDGGGDRSKARDLLFDARYLATSDVALQQRIDQLVELAGG